MKYQKVIIFNLVIIIIGAALYYVISNRASLLNTPSETAVNKVEQTTLQTQTITDGSVTYKVTPKNVASNSETWDFEIILDTHTGSLNQDLVVLVRMVDDKDNVYKAIKWEGAPPGGHHREGVLKFSPIIPRPTFIELTVQTAGSTKVANLRWDL